ncbi:probable galacturonosyltransferase 6 isoform X2 [Asparagus officinalis]|uniref:probable galacturonosyltransferase 6 isoform X2 n=1 Tax=Asparagus officinalis TaxID=4686 RepID=UPI00098E12FD|nr:probable galacturonosyltransferase 6 isoform X2 [Asparagus officinalis]
MRLPPRRLRIPLLALSGLLFFTSFLFLAIVPADFSPALQHYQLIGENSVIRKTTEKLNSIKREINGGLRVPAEIVLKDRNYHAPAENAVQNERSGGLRDAGDGEEVKEHDAPKFSVEREKPAQLSIGEQRGSSRQHPIINEKVGEMEDQLITAQTYLQFAPPNSNSHLVRELKVRIKEIQRVLGHSRGSSLPRGGLQKMRAMEETLSKANKAYPDCSAMASKLRAMTQNTEEQLRAQLNQASYLIQLAASTFPKGLHCLSMRLTTQYFTLEPKDRQFPNTNKTQREDLYHYAIFSDNILACAVVVNSTISSSQAPDQIVFHIVTDSLNFPAMTMWFLLNPPGRATVEIQNMDDLKLLPQDFSLMVKQSGVRDPRFISPLNHLRFYLPDIFPYLNKVLLLDHDVVVQKDLRVLWKINMKRKVIGVVETCQKGDSSHRLDTLVDFSEPTMAKNFDAKACLWAFGMNIFDLHEWRKRGLTRVYSKWLQLGHETCSAWIHLTRHGNL